MTPILPPDLRPRHRPLGAVLAAPLVALLVAQLVALAAARGALAAPPPATFGAAVRYATGPSPQAAVLADLNGDGRADLVATDENGGTVGVLLNAGGGTFADAVTYPVGSFPRPAAGDLTGDGKPDLATANLGDNTVSVLLNAGDGSFSAGATVPLPRLVWDVTLADLDRDGKLDLVVAHGSAGGVTVLRGNGDGTVQTPGSSVSFGPDAGAKRAEVADLNGDGKPDLVVPDDLRGELRILLGNGDGTVALQPAVAVGVAPTSVAVGDFNRDGAPDLAVANSGSGTVGALLGNGDGTFAPQFAYPSQATFSPVSAPLCVVVRDFSGDGALDLAVGNQATNKLDLLLGDTAGAFQAPAADLELGGPLDFLVAGDLDRDGRPDLITLDRGAGRAGVLLNTTTPFARQLIVGAPAGAPIGSPVRVTVATPAVGGALHLTSSDPLALLPADYTVTPADGGSHAFTVVFKTPGGQTLTATDAADALGGSAAVQVAGSPAPRVGLSPATLTFGAQPVGTASGPRAVTLTNSGDAPLAITGIAVSGDFARGGACPLSPATLAAGASCAVEVTFAPTATGIRAGALTISDNASGSPHAVALGGTGIGAGLQYYPLPGPVRLLDTRPGAAATCNTPGRRLTGGTTRDEPARTPCSRVPASAQAVVGNATVVNPAGPGYVSLFPGGAAPPTTSNLNYVAGQIVANAFTVGLGADGSLGIYSSSSTDVILDVTGYYAPPSAGGLYFHPLPNPVRLLDTRGGRPACDMPGTPLASGGTRTESAQIPCTGIPGSAQAVVGNATVVNPAGGGSGYVTIWPGGGERPNASNLNYVPGQIVPNAFTVGLGSDGAFDIYAYTGLDFVVDISGYYSPEPGGANGAGLLYHPLASPIRLLDTRPGQAACDTPAAPLAGDGVRTELARTGCSGVPAGAEAIVGNATVINPASGRSGYVTLWPSGAPQPTVSNLNYVAGQIVPNAVTVGLGGDGAFAIYAYSGVHFIVDLAGYFAP